MLRETSMMSLWSYIVGGERITSLEFSEAFSLSVILNKRSLMNCDTAIYGEILLSKSRVGSIYE